MIECVHTPMNVDGEQILTVIKQRQQTDNISITTYMHTQLHIYAYTQCV